jgi:hypothetical protein
MRSALTQLNIVWRHTTAVVSSSLLPTYWSNCLAGWWLGGDSNPGRLLCLLLGVTCIVVGVVFFKLVYHSEIGTLRFIDDTNLLIGNKLDTRHWWLVSFGWSTLGLAILSWTGPTSTILALIAIVFSVIHGTVCRVVSFAPIFLGCNRLSVFLLAAHAGEHGITGLSLWSGIVMACYTTGIGHIEAANVKREKANFRHASLLFAPLVLALAVNGFSQLSTLLSLALLGWIVASLRYGLPGRNRNPAFMVSNLMTGIALVDLLATGGRPGWLLLAFSLLFILIQLNGPRQPILTRL